MFLPLLKTMRPRQWTKNGLVFVALFFDAKLLHIPSLGRTLLAFLLLCLMSSAVYLMNDLADIESDRQHPKKRFRPLPAGELSPDAARIASILFAGGTLAVSFWLSPNVALILLIYLIIQVGYTFWLKHVVLLDVIMIAAGFVLRLGAGVVVIEVARFSPWMYVCIGLLALFVALGKRRHELLLLGSDAGEHRAILQEYNLDLIDRLIGIVTTSALVAYSMYTFLAEGLPDNHFMMFTIPFVLYAIFRYLYLIHVQELGGTPEEIFISDRPMQAAIFLWGVTAFVALYVLR